MRARPVAWSVLGSLVAVPWAVALSTTPAFSTRAELELSPAIALVFALALSRRTRAPDDRLGLVTRWPAIALMGAGCALELAGLLLGGHSTAVPTLSDALDALTSSSVARTLAALGWLGAGCSRVLARGGEVG